MTQKTVINMMSSATKVEGQGVGSAYLEQVSLVREALADEFLVTENARVPAQITHYHTLDPAFYLGRRHRTRHGRSVGYVHMLPETVETSLDLPPLAKKAFYRYMIRFYKSMDYLVTVNPCFIRQLAAYGVDPARVTYIPNYVSSEQFHPLPPAGKRALRQRYGLPEEGFVVVCAGQLQVRKGFFDYLEIARRMPDVTFVWAGGFSFGAITDGYKEIRQVQQDPPPNLKLLGMVERSRMNEIYNLGDVMFLPSFEELFPMTILEAMCAHVPILLRDLDIYPDILFDFYDCASDLEGFVRELTRLREDPAYYARYQALSQKGNEFYSRAHIAQMWRDFYRMVRDSLPRTAPADAVKETS